jgi:acyl-CoA thioesterase FadM
VIVLVRLLFAIFRSYRTPAIGLLETGVVRTHVWPNDLDLNMHVNSGRYVSLMDIGRIALLAQARLLDAVMAMKWRPIVGGALIHYRQSLHLFDEVDIRTRVVCWDDKWFYFEHVLECDGEVCARGYVRALMRDEDENVPTSEFLAIAGDPDLESPPMPEAIARWCAVEMP